jgi:hypothetical protein
MAMAVDALRPFVVRRRPRVRVRLVCEICAALIGERHAHVLERGSRAILCACAPCAALFKDSGAGGGRLRTIGDRVLYDPRGTIDDAAWATLAVPVGLVFVSFDSDASRWTASYPSPAGPVASEVSDAAWDAFAARVPLARRVQTDVEALVARVRPGAERQVYVAPIDACYELVGAVRSRWTGLQGGDGARAAIEEFFDRLRTRAEAIDPSDASDAGAS